MYVVLHGMISSAHAPPPATSYLLLLALHASPPTTNNPMQPIAAARQQDQVNNKAHPHPHTSARLGPPKELLLGM